MCLASLTSIMLLANCFKNISVYGASQSTLAPRSSEAIMPGRLCSLEGALWAIRTAWGLAADLWRREVWESDRRWYHSLHSLGSAAEPVGKSQLHRGLEALQCTQGCLREQLPANSILWCRERGVQPQIWKESLTSEVASKLNSLRCESPGLGWFRSRGVGLAAATVSV